jgi:hypothetical protein
MLGRDTKNKVGRPPKKASERRRKAGVHGRNRMKLSVPESPKLNGFKLRWFNDLDTNLYDKNKLDDWEFVSEDEVDGFIGERNNTEGLGSRVSILVDTAQNGNPIYAYLMKKKIEYVQEDKAELIKERNEKEGALKRGNDRIENMYDAGNTRIERSN